MKSLKVSVSFYPKHPDLPGKTLISKLVKEQLNLVSITLLLAWDHWELGAVHIFKGLFVFEYPKAPKVYRDQHWGHPQLTFRLTI